MKCRGCGKDMPDADLNDKFDLPARFSVCEECLIAALDWGITQWTKAGCPGAKK